MKVIFSKMDHWHLLLLGIFTFTLVNGASIISDDVNEQGLYRKSNQVIILTNRNFERKIYGQKYALVVQFYNSYCGHCRAFAPKFKSLASDIVAWKNIIQLAVIDCSVEENNGICREFEVMAYPSLRYLHENYVKGNANIGDKLQTTDSTDKLKNHIILKMRTEQSMGRLSMAPPLTIASYESFTSTLKDVPNGVNYTFLVFENENSTIGIELILDLNDYEHVRVKRVYDTSELASIAGVTNTPSVVVVKSNLQHNLLTPNNPTKHNLLKSINTYLKSNNYVFPVREMNQPEDNLEDISKEKNAVLMDDIVYYNDLEKTIKTSLNTEILRYKVLNGERLDAILNYLDVIANHFPFRGNLRELIVDLRNTLSTKHEWSGNEVSELVRRLEHFYAPVYITNLEFVSCKGSQIQYRGYSCGLWTLFHTLTVNAATNSGTEGPKVLRAMLGYITNFFGCTDCAQHFQALAKNNRLFDVKENDKAVLWLWIAHNEVNLRLAGDVTEDPAHPKIQFPSVSKCPECRLLNGAWSLPNVYQYLQSVYGSRKIKQMRQEKSSGMSTSPFSYLDIGLLSLLYILSFIIIIVVIKYLFNKRLYRKRFYKHGFDSPNGVVRFREQEKK